MALADTEAENQELSVRLRASKLAVEQQREAAESAGRMAEELHTEREAVQQGLLRTAYARLQGAEQALEEEVVRSEELSSVQVRRLSSVRRDLESAQAITEHDSERSAALRQARRETREAVDAAHAAERELVQARARLASEANQSRTQMAAAADDAIAEAAALRAALGGERAARARNARATKALLRRENDAKLAEVSALRSQVSELQEQVTMLVESAHVYGTTARAASSNRGTVLGQSMLAVQLVAPTVGSKEN